MNATNNPQLPAYVCTKQFQAAKILSVGVPSIAEPKMYPLRLELSDGETVWQKVHEGYIKRNWPQVGGYFLRTAEGHARYLSVEEFEQDYARVPDPQPVKMADIELLAGQEWKAPAQEQETKMRGKPFFRPDWAMRILESKTAYDKEVEQARQWMNGLKWTEEQLAAMPPRDPQDDPFAFNRVQAELIRLMPTESENLHAAPPYADLLPHKQGEK